MTSKRRQRIELVIACLAAAIFGAACGGKEKETPAGPEDPPEKEEPAKPPKKAEDVKPAEETEETKSKKKFVSPLAKAKLRAAQNKELQQLIGVTKMLRVYSLDEDGTYPNDLKELTDEEPEMARVFDLKNGETGEVKRPLYVRGTSPESPATLILVASPWTYMGKRAVAFCDSSGRVMEEEEYQKALAKTLEVEGMELVE